MAVRALRWRQRHLPAAAVQVIYAHASLSSLTGAPLLYVSPAPTTPTVVEMQFGLDQAHVMMHHEQHQSVAPPPPPLPVLLAPLLFDSFPLPALG